MGDSKVRVKHRCTSGSVVAPASSASISTSSIVTWQSTVRWTGSSQAMESPTCTLASVLSTGLSHLSCRRVDMMLWCAEVTLSSTGAPSACARAWAQNLATFARGRLSSNCARCALHIPGRRGGDGRCMYAVVAMAGACMRTSRSAPRVTPSITNLSGCFQLEHVHLEALRLRRGI